MAKTILVKHVIRKNPTWVTDCLHEYIMYHWSPDGWNDHYIDGEPFTDDQIGGKPMIVINYEIETVAVIYENDPYKIVLFNKKYLKDIRKMLRKLLHEEVLIEIVD